MTNILIRIVYNQKHVLMPTSLTFLQPWSPAYVERKGTLFSKLEDQEIGHYLKSRSLLIKTKKTPKNRKQNLFK